MADGDKTEAPAICRKDGWYYLIGSGCTGWMSNPARSYRAKSPMGPWERLGNPCVRVNPASGLGPERTWGCQSTFILKVSDSDYLAMFDMWRPKNAIDGRYAWVPVTFTDDNKIEVHWKDIVEPRGVSR
jgi:beta-xylosidase